MRHFDENEKQILRILNHQHGKQFQNLLTDKIADNLLIVDYKKNSSYIRYNTEKYTPQRHEFSEKKKIGNEIHERIYLATTLVNFFEQKGYIGLFRNQPIEDKIEIGNDKIIEFGLLTQIEDETINQLLLNYVGKTLVITSEYKEFVKNDFLFKEELWIRKQIRLTWIGIVIAIFIGMFNIALLLKPTDTTPAEKISNDFSVFLKQNENSLSKIDSIYVLLKHYLKIKFDEQLNEINTENKETDRY